MKLWIFSLILVIHGTFFQLKAQEPEKNTLAHENKNIFFSLSGGVQMSGIKNEDFVSNNIALLGILSVGKWFTPLLALQIGYRGNYFNTITDQRRHHYNYFFGESVFQLNELIYPKKQKNILNILFNAGGGYFYNHDYGRSNICAHLGLSSHFKLTEQLTLILNSSAIMGWDIYQGNEDILPGISLGLSYGLN